MLRRDFETFFLGTAMTISRNGAAPHRRETGLAPQKSYGRALSARRADFSSPNVTAPQQFSGRGGGCSSTAANPTKGVGARPFPPPGPAVGGPAGAASTSPPAPPVHCA